MKKIYMRLTSARAREYGLTETIPYPHTDIYTMPIPVDTGKLSPAAAWLAAHMISTEYALGDPRTRPIKRIAGFTMAERDEAKGLPAEYRASCATAYGAEYTREPMCLDVTFPILGKNLTPEGVLEKAVSDARRENDAYFFDPKSGDRYELDPIGTGVAAAKIMLAARATWPR